MRQRRQRRKNLQRGQRTQVPSNQGKGKCQSPAPCTPNYKQRIIHEQMDALSIAPKPTPHRKCDMRVTSATSRPQNNNSIRTSIATSRLKSSSPSHDRSTKICSGAQETKFSDRSLSAKSRASSCSSLQSRKVTLPALSGTTRSQTKTSHKISRSSTQTSRTTTQSKSKICPDPKQISKELKSSGKLSKSRTVPILMAVTPDNVQEEKEKFFSRDFVYNPQFSYRNPPSAKALRKYGKASDKLVKPAMKVLQVTLQRFKTYQCFEKSTGGRPISGAQFAAMFQQYLAEEGLSNKVALNLSDSLVARALMTRTNGKPTLNARPNALKSLWSEGLLCHEIGTHYIRSANNREHPWSSARGRRQHNLRPLNPTEEGIACIHSVLLRKEPFLWRSAMLYYTTYMASRLSFADLFRELGRYMEDPEIRWDYCLRAKRGQVDTSNPGCFNKDQVYLEGAFRVLRYRRVIDFHSLYKLGKVALEDVERLKTLINLDSANLKIPTFMADVDEYRKRLDYVVAKNALDDTELAVLFPGESPCSESMTCRMECLQEDTGHCSEVGEMAE